MEPKSWKSTLLPNSSHLTLLIETPNIIHLIGNGITKHGSRLRSHVLVSRREYNLVSLQLRAIGESKTVRKHSLNLLIWTGVHLEAGTVEAVKKILVTFGLLLGGFNREGFEDGDGKSVNEEIGIVDGRTIFAVDTLEADIGDCL
ncbi:hypothetical protein HG531_000834 [Fusarium graminearum]|nr:hypothetical protein HG531_000834 [Fusarium graminearum]